MKTVKAIVISLNELTMDSLLGPDPDVDIHHHTEPKVLGQTSKGVAWEAMNLRHALIVAQRFFTDRTEPLALDIHFPESTLAPREEILGIYHKNETGIWTPKEFEVAFKAMSERAITLVTAFGTAFRSGYNRVNLVRGTNYMMPGTQEHARIIEYGERKVTLAFVDVR